MSVIRTEGGSMVCAYDPRPDDLFVKVVWHGPGDGTHAEQFDGPPLPIEQYEATVQWAVAMADAMTFPLHVVPLSGSDVLGTEQARRGAAALTAGERGELRRLAVASLAAVMRDSDDPDLRAQAYELLKQMKVVRP